MVRSLFLFFFCFLFLFFLFLALALPLTLTGGLCFLGSSGCAIWSRAVSGGAVAASGRKRADGGCGGGFEILYRWSGQRRCRQPLDGGGAGEGGQFGGYRRTTRSVY